MASSVYLKIKNLDFKVLNIAWFCQRFRRASGRVPPRLWHSDRMQWHWGNIGSALAGLSTLIIAIGALIRSPAVLRDWRARQRAEAEVAKEQAESIRLDRRRYMSGWSAHGVDTFKVNLITDADELAGAFDELRQDWYGPYVVIRVDEGGDRGHDASRAQSLRQIIEAEGYIARPPTAGEREALETGLDAMGIPQAAYGQALPPHQQGQPGS